NPEVTIDLRGVQRRAIADIATPEKRDELWALLTQVAPMYKGYETRTKRIIPIVLVRPIGAADA
ncbi:MAG: nitroreductase/quinone reductase family protein, partial [Ktedonobacterales bacterium]